MSEQFLHGIEVVEVDDGVRPIRTVKSSVVGLIGTAPDADEAEFPLDAPVLLIGSPRKAAKLGGAGTLKDAIDGVFDQTGAVVVVVRVAEGDDIAATLSNVVGDAATKTGVHAFLAAQSSVKATPRILAAPGFTGIRPKGKANPVVAALLAVAERMRAVVVADGPNTTDTDAIAYREDWGSARVYVVDPHAMVWDTATNGPVAQPASARVAGLVARVDNDRGFWWSPSNQVVNGIVGVSRPVDFNMSDPNSTANYLNERDVATIVQKDGYRLWGNRTTAADPLWAFLSVRRTADMVYESIENAYLWAMDRPFSAQLLRDIAGGGEAYLRRLTSLGAILGGRVWLDEELNTPTAFQSGKLYVDFDIEPPAPMERLTFMARRDAGYYTEMFKDAASGET